MGEARRIKAICAINRQHRIEELKAFIEQNKDIEIDEQATDAWDLEIAVDAARDELKYLEAQG